jgi:hypothetical protein
MNEPASAAGDEGAALQWAIENFRNNAHNRKDPDSAKKRLAYNKKLLLDMKYIVETIQRGNWQSPPRSWITTIPYPAR